MGVTIHYRGTLADKSRLAEFKEELIDIAESMEWKYKVMDEEWSLPNTATLVHAERGVTIQGHMPLKGVSIHPHKESEWLSLYFDSEGRIMSPFNMIMRHEDGKKPEECFTFIKTQFAPPEMHVAMVKLLRYIKNKYIPDLVVHDEGGYWETDDEDELRQRMGIINVAIAALAKGLENANNPRTSKLTETELVKLLETILRESTNMKFTAHVVNGKTKPKSKKRKPK